MKDLSSILDGVDDSWLEILEASFDSMDKEYIDFLKKDSGYFPSKENFLNAFKTLSLHKTRYILFGQDPYPRRESAIGYAFVDGIVKNIFSDNGFSKEVNRATSLRNFLKMVLLSNGYLFSDDLSQDAIAKIDKSSLCKTMDDVRQNFEKSGVLLLNISLIFTSKNETKYHLKFWKIFMDSFLKNINNKEIKLILFGNIAKEITKLESSKPYKRYSFKHPYNIDFIYDKEVHKLFSPMNLMSC